MSTVRGVYCFYILLTDFTPLRFAHEYRVDREHQPVVVVPAGVTGQVSSVRKRFKLLLSGREHAAPIVFAGHHVRRDDVIIVDRLVQRVFRVSQQLRDDELKTVTVRRYGSLLARNLYVFVDEYERTVLLPTLHSFSRSVSGV